MLCRVLLGIGLVGAAGTATAQPPQEPAPPPTLERSAEPAAGPAAAGVTPNADGEPGAVAPDADPAGASAPDWHGAGRDAAYFAGYQVVGLAVVYLLPESISGWTDEKKQENSGQWRTNVTNPVMWDGDTFFVNWVLHPYWGGAYYMRGRERGLNPGQSFWFSAALSAMWEYGAEAVAEPVSIQDLVFTPVLGSLVGHYLFEPWRQRLRSKGGEQDAWDRLALVLIDPLGAINETIDGWFGVKTRVQLQPLLAPGRSVGSDFAPPGMAIGAPRSGKIRGLQLRVEW